MTSTDTLSLQERTAAAMERRNRHLADHKAEGLQFDGVENVELRARRIRRAKKAYSVREFHRRVRENGGEGLHLVRGTEVTPTAGDLVLARVQSIGQHKRLESYNSRRRNLFAGDEIVVAYGDRYAPDQFLAEVPRNLNFTNLVAAGGMAGRVIEKHKSISPATVIEPLGLIADDEGVINMRRLAPLQVKPWKESLAAFSALENKPRVITVFGSSMNSGKSTTLGMLVNGLSGADLQVNAGKATGTGAGGDAGLFRDAGADEVIDFTDFGLNSTFKLTFEQVKDVLFSTVNELAHMGEPDVVLVEIADGIYQGETASLLVDDDFGKLTERVVFSCGEALSAAAGVDLIQRAGLPLVAVSGVLTSSPLVAREAAQVVDVPIVNTFDLAKPEVALEIAGL